LIQLIVALNIRTKMSTNFDELIKLMKECDKTHEQLIGFENKCQRNRLLKERNEIINDLNSTNYLKSIVEFEDKIRSILKNEELIKLYFYRFLVNENKTNDELNGFYLQIKDESKQLLETLLTTIKTIVSTQELSENDFDLKANNELLSKVLRSLTKDSLKTMAETDLKMHSLAELK